jgi:hypothetical protein
MGSESGYVLPTTSTVTIHASVGATSTWRTYHGINNYIFRTTYVHPRAMGNAAIVVHVESLIIS